MSDLSATHCGCNNNNDGCGCDGGGFNLFGGSDNNCCNTLIWLLILSSCCG